MVRTIATEYNIILQCIVIPKNFLLTVLLYSPFAIFSKFKKIYDYLLFIVVLSFTDLNLTNKNIH